MASDRVARVRRFNRTITQRIGALQDRYLARGRPLGHARVLWEIGDDGREVRALRARLDLDSGYLSRLLRALESDGLVAVDGGEAGADSRAVRTADRGARAAGDRRVRTARLTTAGRAERAELDRRSDDLAAAILDPLDERQRDRLVAAMDEVERLLLASMVDVAVTDPRHPDARLCMRAYYAELAERFATGFEPERSILAADHELTPPAGLLLVARLHGEPVGCGALKLHDTVAEIKRMWVAPDVRGLGLGRRLLAELEARADRRTLRLETNGALREAVALYRAAGFREVAPFNDEPYAHHWFEK